MKKFLSLFIVVAMAFTFFACSRGGNDDKTSEDKTTTHEQGVNGSLVDGDNFSSTDVSSDGQEVTMKEPEPMPSGDVIKKPTNENGLPINADHLEKIRKIFASGKFTMSVIMNVEFEGKKIYVPATIYVSGKKYVMESELGVSTLMGILGESSSKELSALFGLFGVKSFKFRQIKTEDKCYIVLDSVKQYKEIPLEDVNNSAVGGIGAGTIDGAEYAGTSNVKVNGKMYVCEQFKASGGEVRKFYFLDGEFKRMEIVNNGQTTVVEIKSISGTVDDSIFSFPSTYKEIKQ